jgi:hypothetical protein
MLAEMGNGGMSKVADGVWRSCFWMSVMVMSRTTDDNNTGEGDGERKTVLVGVEFVAPAQLLFTVLFRLRKHVQAELIDRRLDG